MSERAQANMAVVVMVFFGTIIVGGLMWLMLDQVWDPFYSIANNSTNTTAASDGLALYKTAWNVALIFVSILAAIAGVGGAAATRRRRI